MRHGVEVWVESVRKVAVLSPGQAFGWWRAQMLSDHWRQPVISFILFSESQNHRIVGVGRDLCGSSSPTPLPKQGHLQ